MTKEAFTLSAFRLLLKNTSVGLGEMKPEGYGISRATAWRLLDSLRQADLVF